jgi:hypothetical protein
MKSSDKNQKRKVLIERYNRFYDYLNKGMFNESRLHTIGDCLNKIEYQILAIK